MTEDNFDEKYHPLRDVSQELRKKRYRVATRRGYLDLLTNALLMTLLVVITFSKIFLITVASGTDMYPAVLDGDILLGYRLDSEYSKNDVVVYEVSDQQMVGRVVARGGDNVNITEDGVLYVNGTEQTGEIAFVTDPGNQTYPYIVPEGYLYILGDYRTQAVDSRTIGAVNENDIKAKVVNIFRRRGI